MAQRAGVDGGLGEGSEQATGSGPDSDGRPAQQAIRDASPCERRQFLHKSPHTTRLLCDDTAHYYTRDPFFIVHPPKPYLLTRSALDALRVTAWLRPTQRTHADQQSGAPATRTGRRAPWGQDERQDSDWELNQ